MLALPGAATTAPDARVASARVAWSGPSRAPHISIFRATSASSSDAATAAASVASIESRTSGGCGSLLGIQRGGAEPAVAPAPRLHGRPLGHARIGSIRVGTSRPSRRRT